MKLKDKLYQLRKSRGLSQGDVANSCGITRQTYIAYEKGYRYPRTREIYERLARYFAVDVNYLFGQNEQFVTGAGESYGPRGMAQARELAGELAGMFAGGELSDEDKFAVMQTLEEAFWLAKKKNRKYSKKNPPDTDEA